MLKRSSIVTEPTEWQRHTDAPVMRALGVWREESRD